jgi:hypothetical protein
MFLIPWSHVVEKYFVNWQITSQEGQRQRAFVYIHNRSAFQVKGKSSRKTYEVPVYNSNITQCVPVTRSIITDSTKASRNYSKLLLELLLKHPSPPKNTPRIPSLD